MTVELLGAVEDDSGKGGDNLSLSKSKKRKKKIAKKAWWTHAEKLQKVSKKELFADGSKSIQELAKNDSSATLPKKWEGWLPEEYYEINNEQTETKEEDKPDVEKIIEAGSNKYKNAKYPKAVQLFEKALVHTPWDANLIHKIAKSYSKLLDHDNVIEYCKREILLNPQNTDAFLLLSKSYCAKGKMKEVVKCLNLASELDPNNETIQKELDFAKKELESADAFANAFDNEEKSGGKCNIM